MSDESNSSAHCRDVIKVSTVFLSSLLGVAPPPGLKKRNQKSQILMQPTNAPNCYSRHSDLKGLCQMQNRRVAVEAKHISNVYSPSSLNERYYSAYSAYLMQLCFVLLLCLALREATGSQNLLKMRMMLGSRRGRLNFHKTYSCAFAEGSGVVMFIQACSPSWCIPTLHFHNKTYARQACGDVRRSSSEISASSRKRRTNQRRSGNRKQRRSKMVILGLRDCPIF